MLFAVSDSTRKSKHGSISLPMCKSQEDSIFFVVRVFFGVYSERKVIDQHYFSLKLPASPRGFGVDVNIDEQSPVNLIGSLTIAVEAMYTLTLLPWEGALRESFPVISPGIAERVIFHPLTRLDADEQMDTQDMVIGLFVGALTISTQERTQYYATTVTTKMRRQRLGLVYIGTRGEDTATEAKDQLNDTLILLGRDGRPLDKTAFTAGSLADESGILADPTDLNFRINYRLLSSPDPLDPRGILLAALDFLANAAQYEFYSPFRQLEGRDTRTQPSALVMVNKLAKSNPRAGVLTYRQASRGVQLLIRMMKLIEVIAEVEFQLEYRGFQFGKGSIKRPGRRVENGTDLVDTA